MRSIRKGDIVVFVKTTTTHYADHRPAETYETFSLARVAAMRGGALGKYQNSPSGPVLSFAGEKYTRVMELTERAQSAAQHLFADVSCSSYYASAEAMREALRAAHRVVTDA